MIRLRSVKAASRLGDPVLQVFLLRADLLRRQLGPVSRQLLAHVTQLHLLLLRVVVHLLAPLGDDLVRRLVGERCTQHVRHAQHADHRRRRQRAARHVRNRRRRGQRHLNLFSLLACRVLGRRRGVHRGGRRRRGRGAGTRPPFRRRGSWLPWHEPVLSLALRLLGAGGGNSEETDQGRTEHDHC